MEMDGEARPGEEDGKAGLEEEDGEAGLEEEDGEARPGEEGKAKVTATEALATLSFLTMTETLLWLGLSLRRVGKGTPAVVRPDNKLILAFERSGLLGLCNSFTSARTLLVNRGAAGGLAAGPEPPFPPSAPSPPFSSTSATCSPLSFTCSSSAMLPPFSGFGFFSSSKFSKYSIFSFLTLRDSAAAAWRCASALHPARLPGGPGRVGCSGGTPGGRRL